MIKKTLYFGNPAYLSLRNKQLVIRMPDLERQKDLPDIIKREATVTIPIEDIGIVVLDSKEVTITQGLMAALLDASVALVTCNDKRMPVGLFLPLQGNSVQNERFRNQLGASLPLLKQLWQQTVKAKIENQRALLSLVTTKETACMSAWARDVRSGDPDNLEARAAVYYWKNVFYNMPDFVRDRDGEYPNNLLNYGYAILRAVVARALVVSGLLPVMGIHHHNKYNAYCLADDIMEPYRPFVDRLVISIMESGRPVDTLDKGLKAHLLGIPTLDVTIGGRHSPLMVAVAQTTASLAKCFAGELRKIAYPVLT